MASDEDEGEDEDGRVLHESESEIVVAVVLFVDGYLAYIQRGKGGK